MISRLAPPATCKESEQDRFEPEVQGAGKVRFTQPAMGFLRHSGSPLGKA
jgi:hypothetical protein